jgi:glycosyltransferase involved in cell wall biosynthesis
MQTVAPREPLVSVIIAAHNAAAFIREAIDSALASAGVFLEVLVIDDASTDATWAILESYGDRIRAVRQDKGGAYRARNLGATLARGEWLAFLDADDVWLPSKLSRQLAVAGADVDLVYTECLNFGSLDRVTERQSDSTRFFEGDVFEPLLVNNFISLSSVLVRAGAFRALGGFSVEQAGVQDWDLWLRLAESGRRVAFVPEPLTRYRLHDGQMTNNLLARAHDRVNVLERALATPRGRRVSRRVASRARANVWSVGGWIAKRSAPGQAIRWYLRSAFYWPWNAGVYKELVKCCLGRT